MEEKKYRYPGTKPFEISDRNLFFGRDADIEKLYRHIVQNKTVLLYSKSGYGKSSLLNAGVIPKFMDDDSWQVIPVRFNSYNEKSYNPPVETISLKLRSFLKPGSGTLLDRLIPNESSLWYHCKNLHLQKLQQAGSSVSCRFLFVFDQFEELFTYPGSMILQFKEQLSAMLYSEIPQDFRFAFEQKTKRIPGFFSEEEIEPLYQPMDVKCVFTIRSDRMSQVNLLADYIPNIQQVFYELKALNPVQAEEAIRQPAENDREPFESPVFHYDNAALDLVLDRLSRKDEVEASQLQIICQYIEHNLVIEQGKRIIEKDDLANIQQVFDDYYELQISAIDGAENQKAARNLIENGLIVGEGTDAKRHRVIYELIQKEYNVGPQVLEQLVRQRLLRPEEDLSGNTYYEISHDTLVVTILKARKKRLEEEKRIEENRKKEEELVRARKKTLFWIRTGIAGAVLTILAILLTVWAFNSRSKAIFNEKKADSLNMALREQADVLEMEKKAADSSRDLAERESARAEKNASDLKTSNDELQTQVNKVRALSDKASELTYLISGPEEPYKVFLMKGIENIAAINYENALYNFGLARFTMDTPIISEWIEVAKEGKQANNLFDQGKLEEAKRIYSGHLDTIVTLLTKTSAGYIDPSLVTSGVLRKIAEIRRIEKIWNDSMTGEPMQIRKLNLGQKELSSLPAALGNLTNLESLILADNQFAMIPPPVLKLRKLQHLDISHNIITAISSDIGNLAQLYTLDLSSNRITSLPGQVKALTKLISLSLDDNQLFSVPPEIGKLKELRILWLSSNNLKSLPPEIWKLEKLRALRLSFNRLTSLPPGIGQLSMLEDLSLIDNELQKLPDELTGLANLKTLYANYNQITVLPETVGNMGKLAVLNLYSNKITSIPSSIAQLSSLQELNLGANEINSLPAGLFNLPGLAQLDLSQNRIAAIPDRVAGLKNTLAVLNLQKNQLVRLPDSLCELANLNELDIRQNQLASLPAGIGGMKNLRDLYANDNQLTLLPDQIGLLTGMTKLILSGNKLADLPPEFFNLANLEILDLSDNRLTNLGNDIGRLKKLRYLYLSGNPIPPGERERIENLLPGCNVQWD